MGIETSDSGAQGSPLAALHNSPPVPNLWFFGKTGAGKSSLLRALTGLEEIDIGAGYKPCTATTQALDYPAEAPLMRFLDTRGIEEAGYDPEADIAQLSETAHVLIVVARIDDPVQAAVSTAVRKLLRSRPKLPALLVLTGSDLLRDAERDRAITALEAHFHDTTGKAFPTFAVALPVSGQSEGLGPVRDELTRLLPEVALLISTEIDRTEESNAFLQRRAGLLRFCVSAGSADVAPVVGAVAAPAVQAAMLRWMARQYGLPWSRKLLFELSTLLGIGVLGRFAASYGIRQAVKLVPVAGQTAGAAAAGAISFASTYAMGRAAAYFFFWKKHGSDVSAEEVRAVFKDALKRAGRDEPTP